ncbi:signal peptidase I [Candidatus Dependentiae bacterium]
MAYSGSRNKSKSEGFWANVREIGILLLIVLLIRTFGFGLYQVPTGSMETTMLVGERFFADKFTIMFSNIKRGDIIAFNDPLFDYSDNKVNRLFQEYLWGPSNWTKRVIGTPGDEVKGVVENGKPVVYINGKKLNEPYINKYPLIQVWKMDVKEVQKIARNRGQRVNLGQFLSPKSYDPNKPFDNQPFYDIKPSRILTDNETGEPIVILPGTPLEKGRKVTKGKNYWNNGDEFYVKLGKDQYWVMGDNRLGSHDSRVFGPIRRRLIHGKILFRIWSLDSDENWWIWDLIKNPISFFKRVRWNRFFQVVR